MKTRAIVSLFLVLLVSHTSGPPVAAFHISTHRRITLDALNRRGVKYNGVRVTFSDDATVAIDREARDFDKDAALGINLTEPFRHFDDESFEAGSRHVIEMKEKVIAELKKDDMDEWSLKRAIRYFAYGMHAIQDFYAHSNWVELGELGVVPKDICPTLGSGPFQVPIASKIETTCVENYKLSDAGLSKLTSGYWPGWSLVEVLPFVPEKCEILPNKCHHGKKSCSEGIAKDPEGEPAFKRGDPKAFEAGGPNAIKNCGKHDPDCKYREQAEQLAIKATIQFAELIINDAAVKPHCKNVGRFMGIKL